MKTTRAQFQMFTRSAKKWVRLLGLSQWEIYYKHGKLEDDTMAQAAWDSSNKVCYFTFCTEWDNEDIPMTPDEIKASAFHEVVHILLEPLDTLASNRFVSSEKSFDDATHEVIKRLQNVFVDKKWL